VWVLLGSAVAGAAAGPFVFPGASPEVVANRERIAAMSPSQRSRLDQKFQAYEALTPEQRDALKTLHGKLAEDQIQTKGLKTAVMNDYVAWINTIPAYRREELLQKTDPTGRIEAMKQILEVQHTRTLENPDAGGQGAPVRLSPAAISEIMKIVERYMREDLGDEQLAEFDKLSEAFRQADAAAMLSRQIGPMIPFPSRLGPMLGEIAQATGHGGFREVLRRPGEGPKPFLVGMNMMLLSSAERSLRRELANRRVTSSELEAFFQGLPAEQQDQLTNLSADDFRSKLRIEYLGRETAVVKRLEEELRRMRGLAQRMGPWRPEGRADGRPDGGGGRPEGFRPGDNRPGDNRPGENRPGEPGMRGREFDGRRNDRPPGDGSPRGDGPPREDGPPQDRGDRDRPPPKD